MYVQDLIFDPLQANEPLGRIFARSIHLKVRDREEMDVNSAMSSIKALIYPNEGPHKIVVCYFKCSPRSLIIFSDGSFSEHSTYLK